MIGGAVICGFIYTCFHKPKKSLLSTRVIGALDLKGNRMTVYFNSYIQPFDGSRITFPVNISNIVAEIRDSVDLDRAYVVTGHYDSRRIDILDYKGDAPGVSYNASSVSAAFRGSPCLYQEKTRRNDDIRGSRW